MQAVVPIWMPNTSPIDVQTVSRVAVIGSGISGLAAAYYLSRKHTVSVFEHEDRIGGHTNTIMVDSSAGPLAVDTGFIVHNDRTYPHFCRLMSELGVEAQLSDMSFGVSSSDGSFEYSSRGLRGFFAQPAHWTSPSHYLLLREILRFNREAPKFLESGREVSLLAFLDEGRYHPVFVERYLYPMAAAVWSMAADTMGGFPAMTLLRFFDNHGLLGINTHPQWKTLRGGSHSYLKPLTRPYAGRIQTGVNIRAVTRCDCGVRLEFTGGKPAAEFDHVVFACHGNQVLPMLADATDFERDVLGNFETSRNEVCLHTDVRMMPRRRAAWASWNVRLGSGAVQVTYDMNRLQKLPTAENYCVTLNATAAVAAEKVVRKMVYQHPVYSRVAVAAQRRWDEVSGIGRTHFCGAYWFFGFHEDGVRSALRVAAELGVAV